MRHIVEDLLCAGAELGSGDTEMNKTKPINLVSLSLSYENGDFRGMERKPMSHETQEGHFREQ